MTQWFGRLLCRWGIHTAPISSAKKLWHEDIAYAYVAYCARCGLQCYRDSHGNWYRT